MNQGLAAMTQMKRSATASVLLRQGSATEMARLFAAGCEVAPFSVGSCADWCVTADGVEPHHFYLCFDGHTLFAATAAGGPLTMASGKRIAARWTRLPDGSVLTFGGASMAVTNLGERRTRPPPLPAPRAEPRGPRVLDPFACETLAYARFSPPAAVPRELLDEPTVVRPSSELLEAIGVASAPLDERTVVRPSSEALAAIGVAGEPLAERTVARPSSETLPATFVAREPLEERTVVYRPWAREFALEPFDRGLDESLAQTLARPVTTPMAVTVSTTAHGVVAQPTGLAAPRPSARSRAAAHPTFSSIAQTPLLRKCIAGLIVAALVLIGVHALTRRQPLLPLKPAAAATASGRPIIAARGAPSGRLARSEDQPRNAEPSPLSIVNGRTPERQAVDLVARGAYTEAAALYDRLARWHDVPAFREAARIARRKARLAK